MPSSLQLRIAAFSFIGVSLALWTASARAEDRVDQKRVAAVKAIESTGSQDPLASALERLRDAETLKTLTTEGQLLYQRERIKLSGYQYCDQAVGLAERGEFRASIRAASKALHIATITSDEGLRAVAKRDLAIAYSYAGALDAAERFARDALLHHTENPRLVEGPAWKTIGDVFVRRGNVSAAIRAYENALERSSDRFKPLVLMSLANAYVAERRLEQANEVYAQVPEARSAVLQPFHQRGVASLRLAEGRSKEALALFRAAQADAAGIDASYHRLWAHEGAARALLAQSDVEGARVEYAAAARLAEGLRARFRSEEFKTGLFGDVQRVFEGAIALALEVGDTAEAWRLSEASRARALLDIVRGRIAAPYASNTRLVATPVALEEARAGIAEREAMVAFHVLEDRLVAWVIRRDGVSSRVIPVSRTALEDAVEALRKSIVELREEGAKDHARALFDRLIKPLDLREDERLVIVPHGPLHYLPFQALVSPSGYLIEAHPIAVAPSAAVAIAMVREARRPEGPFIAFGNPEIEPRLDLPGAEREVKTIAEYFSDRALFMQRDASKSRFREASKFARVLHVAAHAEVDAIDPLQSRILLAPEGDETGMLVAREVYELDLRNTALVTLSACESGLGRVARGDEILGFTRSFLAAGANGLIVSLWPVEDEATELLMAKFYEALAAGALAIDAMQSAQVAVLRRQRLGDPLFWAPFNFIGDWRLRTADRGAQPRSAAK